MIDLHTGTVWLEEVDLPLSSSLTREVFCRQFPSERIVGAWPLRTGYTWYFLRERLYPQDLPAGLQLCFAPDGALFSLELLPGYAPEGSPWSPETGLLQKAACDQWLLDRCGIALDPASSPYPRSSCSFSWGELATYFDPRSGSCGILLCYKSPCAIL